jgi:purine-nucleoside phosphorylase
MQGRLHFYEGLAMEDVVFPFRAFALAGAEIFILTNAAGGVRPECVPPELCLVRDHINLMGTNPLVGHNHDELGPRFPDMTHLYDPELCKIFLETAARLKIPLREGIYLALHGPSYETPAEIRMYRTLGADVVGMSTVPEAIAIHHMGRRVVTVSCITNLAAGVSPVPLVHTEVLENAQKAYQAFSRLLIEAVRQFEKLPERAK